MDICTRSEVRPLPNLTNEDCQQSYLECSNSAQVGRNYWIEKWCPDGQKFSTKLKVCTPTCSWSSDHCTLDPGKCNCTDDLGTRWIVDKGKNLLIKLIACIEKSLCLWYFHSPLTFLRSYNILPQAKRVQNPAPTLLMTLLTPVAVRRGFVGRGEATSKQLYPTEPTAVWTLRKTVLANLGWDPKGHKAATVPTNMASDGMWLRVQLARKIASDHSLGNGHGCALPKAGWTNHMDNSKRKIQTRINALTNGLTILLKRWQL